MRVLLVGVELVQLVMCIKAVDGVSPLPVKYIKNIMMGFHKDFSLRMFFIILLIIVTIRNNLIV